MKPVGIRQEVRTLLLMEDAAGKLHESEMDSKGRWIVSDYVEHESKEEHLQHFADFDHFAEIEGLAKCPGIERMLIAK